VIFQPDMNSPAQKSPRRQNNSTTSKTKTHLGVYTNNPALLDNKIHHGLLKQQQVGLFFQELSNRLTIELPIRLGTGCPNGRSLARVEDAILDPGTISRFAHDAVQGVNFPNQMAFTDTTNGRITGHLANGF
jgi:hypothetical protein